MKFRLFWMTYFIALPISLYAACNRRPQGANGDRSPVDENFQILIEGNPRTYIPGQQYNISLSCANDLKFISFTMVIENEQGASPGYDMFGHFEIIDEAETKFNLMCENMIESTNTNTKSRVNLAWVAPTNPESGCLAIKAAVLQHRNVWFIDDGFLTKRICPEEIDEINSQTPPVNPCCACDEAKYEIMLERRWSRNTHNAYFPKEAWRTRFSEIIGASHTFDYRFWEYGRRASRGLQEMAEHGATSTLEEEIKSNTDAGSIRTIIKAPGIIHRNNVLGTTLANVRVDPEHHVISLVSKIDPSPDWILGVAGLELCLANCTWIDRKVLNLYPWDIGTDSGPSYMSPDQPQVPPDVVRRITSTFPSDYRSPFYDDKGAPMKPLAILYITKKKLYERDCEFSEDNVPLECLTHPWNNWSECSSKCGAGTHSRTRFYKDPILAESFNCQAVLSETKSCTGNQCGSSYDDESRTPSAECELSHWGEWSRCSKNCGRGFTTRSRDYLNPYAREKCQSASNIELEQTKDCFGNDCGGTIRGGYDNDDKYSNEPGLLEENELENRFQPNRNRGRISNTNRNGMNKPFEQEDDNSNANTFGEKSSYPPSYPRKPYYSKTAVNEDSVPQEDIYGSDQLVGQQRRPFEEQNRNIDLNANSPYNRNQPKDFTSQRHPISYPKEPNQNWNKKDPNNRFNQDDDEDGIRKEYDEFGHKTIMVEGVDSSNYAVVQEYCFEKPFASMQPCKKVAEIKNYWFYDAEERVCKIFTTDNCDENKNKFRTLEACEGTCHRPQQNLEETQDGYDDQQQYGDDNNRFGPPQSLVRTYGTGVKNQQHSLATKSSNIRKTDNPGFRQGQSKMKTRWSSQNNQDENTEFGQPLSQINTPWIGGINPQINLEDTYNGFNQRIENTRSGQPQLNNQNNKRLFSRRNQQKNTEVFRVDDAWEDRFGQPQSQIQTRWTGIIKQDRIINNGRY